MIFVMIANILRAFYVPCLVVWHLLHQLIKSSPPEEGLTLLSPLCKCHMECLRNFPIIKPVRIGKHG